MVAKVRKTLNLGNINITTFIFELDPREHSKKNLQSSNYAKIAWRFL